MSSAPSFCSSASRVVSPSVSPGVFYQIKNPSSGLNFLHEVQCYWTLWIWTLFFLICKILFTFYQRDTNLDVGFTSRNGRLAWKIKLTKKRSVNSCYSNRQYKITSLTWFGTDILSLCGLFSQLTEQILFTRPSSVYHLLLSSITCTDSGRDSPQCSRAIRGSRSRHRRNIPIASRSCW